MLKPSLKIWPSNFLILNMHRSTKHDDFACFLFNFTHYVGDIFRFHNDYPTPSRMC